MRHMTIYNGPGVFGSVKQFQCVDIWLNSICGDFTYIHNVSTFPEQLHDTIVIPPCSVTELKQHVSNDHLEHIKQFVYTGGTYIGMCGGGYLACENIVYDGKHNTGLGLVDCTATGSLNSSDIGKINKDPKCVSLVDIKYNEKISRIPYLLGCGFTGDTFEVTSVYDNGLASSIKSKYGSGTVILVGVHPELGFNYWNNWEFNDNGELLRDMNSSEGEMLDFSQYILSDYISV